MIPDPSPLFATNANFAAGSDPWSGTQTRVDPSAPRRAEGFEPDSLPAQWLNHTLGTHGDWIEYERRRRLATALGTWTARVPPSNFPVKAIAARGALIAGVGVIPTLPTDHALAIINSGGGDTVHGSSDGSIWTASSSGISQLIEDLRYLPNANRWIAVGGTTNGAIFSRTAGNLATSWTVAYGPTGATFTHIACSDSRAIAIGLSARVITSTDGTTWTALTALPETATGIAYGGGIFVTVYRDTIRTSTDGSTWTTRQAIAAAAGATESRVAYDSTRDRFFVASSAGGTSKIWTFPASDPSDITSISLAENAEDLACVNGVLALVSLNHVRFSDDAGASFAYAYTGPSAALGTRLGVSDVLSCVFVGGDDGAGGAFLTQSMRGV